jgi:hypothetical protein
MCVFLVLPPFSAGKEMTLERLYSRRILNGFDKDGRPILYVRSGSENTKTSLRQVQHLV